MSELNGLPVLGQQKFKAPVGPPIALIKSLDDDCLFEPGSTQLINGQVMALTGRQNLVTAEDLVDMLVDALVPQLKALIRQELAYQKTLDGKSG